MDIPTSRAAFRQAQRAGAALCVWDGDDLRGLPLSMRKTNVARLLARRPNGIFLSDFEQGEIGPDLFRAACRMGLEGLVSKHRDRPYRGAVKSTGSRVKNREHPAMDRHVQLIEKDDAPAPASATGTILAQPCARVACPAPASISYYCCCLPVAWPINIDRAEPFSRPNEKPASNRRGSPRSALC